MPALLTAPTTTPAAPPAEISVRIQGDFVMIALPIKKDLPLSQSGGSRILAQTKGFTKIDGLTYNGLPVTVAGISVIVPKS